MIGGLVLLVVAGHDEGMIKNSLFVKICTVFLNSFISLYGIFSIK